MAQGEGQGVGGGLEDDYEGRAGDIYGCAEEEGCIGCEQADGYGGQGHGCIASRQVLGCEGREDEGRHQQHYSDEAYGQYDAYADNDCHHQIDGRYMQSVDSGEIGVKSTCHYLAVAYGNDHKQDGSVYGFHDEVSSADGQYVAEKESG